MGYAIGLTSSTLSGPSPISQWASKFTRKLVRHSFGGELYVLSALEAHMALLNAHYRPLVSLDPGKVGLEDCESLFTHMTT